jgi:hypothetical protein
MNQAVKSRATITTIMVSNAVELQKIICGLQMMQLAMRPLNLGVQTSERRGTCCHSLDLDHGSDFFLINFETEKEKDYGYILSMCSAN